MMKHFTLAILLTLGLAQPALSQCTETDKTKVLLVGDSWAFFMGVDQTINNVFEQWGFSNYKFYTNPTLAENGARTTDFLEPDKQAEILAQLNANPDIEVVHLSIGGNDYLGDWDVSFTQTQTEVLLDTITNRLIRVIDFIKSCKPGIQIFWSGYAYPNFEEVIESAAPFQTVHPFYSTWSGMGFPNFTQINTALADVSARMEAYTLNDPQVHFVNAAGILQYTFGQNSPLGVAPFGSYPPQSVTLPIGNINYPSPRNSMRDYLITKDCFHLSPQGYRDFIGYHTQKYYHKFLMDDQYILADSANMAGSVSSLGTISPELRLGEDAGEQFSTVLSFNTTTMPDTGVSAASIFIRRTNVTGNNPIGNTLQIKVKSGMMGTTLNLDADDFTDPADDANTPCQFGSNSNGGWIRLELPASALPFINRNAVTQIVISAPDAAAGMAYFSNANDPDFAPVLNLVYGPQLNTNTFNLSASNDLTLYPNPTDGMVYIKSSVTILSLQVYNSVGQVVYQGPYQAQLDLKHAAAGMYWVEAQTTDGALRQLLIKH